MSRLMRIGVLIALVILISASLYAQGTLEPDKTKIIRSINALLTLFIVVSAVICLIRRKKPIGGWLLFYFIWLFFGFLIWCILTISTLPRLNPGNWLDKRGYAYFLATSIPTDLLLLAQLSVSVLLLRTKKWLHVKLLKIILALQIASALVIILIDTKYFPSAAIFRIFDLITTSLWLLYFSFSPRVRSSYQKQKEDIRLIA
ncbi:MAG: DUF2569 family protein [Candidatus Omnitrophica bacterium]|nr:DUF2569 family protein [Candidatus Omnitrophota bacterium]MDD5237542.1 DUF2569 family protein [Candidatus Omnitrophota bacterium]